MSDQTAGTPKVENMGIFDMAYAACRFVLGGIFIYAGGTKLLEPEVFAVLIESYGILPDLLVMPTAVVLPALEVVAGIGILADIRGSLSTIAGLLVLFMAILGYGIFLGLDVDCGCFGPDDPESKAYHGLRTALVRDLLMLGGVAFAFGYRRWRGIRPKPVRVVLNYRRKK